MNITNTCTVDLVDTMGDDLRVVNAARVSFAKESQQFEGRDTKLLAYLAKNNHWTPFSHVMVTLRISAPVFVARQWFRSVVGTARNETSRRYVDDAPTYFLPDDLRSRPDASIKQGSGGKHPWSEYWLGRINKMYEAVDTLYAGMVRDGVAPEQARIILPVSHVTEWYETASLAFYGRVAGLRLDSHAQGEIQDLMKLVAAAVEPVAPVSWAALVG